MKQKIYTRPVSITLTDEMFERIKEITDSRSIGISDYIREAIQTGLENDDVNNQSKNNKGGN